MAYQHDKIYRKNKSVCILHFSLHIMLYLVRKRLYMLLLFRWDGFSLLWFGLLRLLSGYLGCNLWPSWANIRLSKPLLLVKTVKNTSNNMDRFAYSLQDVLSYFIWSPRCLYDGSEVAYGGRTRPGISPDGATFASRWFHVYWRWLQDFMSIQDGFKMSLFRFLDRIFVSRSRKVGWRWLYDGFKVAYGGRKWFKFDVRRTHDASKRSQDGSR